MPKMGHYQWRDVLLFRSMGFQANIDPAGGCCVDGCAVVSPCFASVDLMAGAAARPVADQRGGRASR
jgi:hypothetical protein